jgi:DNA-binding LytR/AlgR family response regulator
MSDILSIKLIIEEGWPEITVYIKSGERNEDVEGIISAIESYSDRRMPKLPAYFHDSMVILPQMQIIRIFMDSRKAIAETSQRMYELRMTLKEAEEILDDRSFVRISQSEIINLRRVKSFDFSTSGTIGVVLENGEKTWVSRRRVKSVKDALTRDRNKN